MGDFRFGGAEAVGVNLANAYCDKGHPVTIIALRGNGGLNARLNHNVTVVVLNRRLIFALKGLIRQFSLVQSEFNNAPTIFISTIRNLNILTAIALRFVRPENLKIIMREANTFRQLLHLGAKERLIYRAYKFALPWAYSAANVVIANSEDTKNDLVALGVNNRRDIIAISGNPIAIKKSAQKSKQSFAKRKGPLNVLSVGRLHPQKDYKLAIESLNLLSNTGIDINYSIVGEGDLKAEILSYPLAKRLSLEIKKPREDLSAEFLKADVFLLTSKWEGFGNVIVEAMAQSVTPVVVDCPGAPKDIIFGGYGKLAERDSKSICEAIQAAVYSPVSKKTLAEGARRYDAPIIADKYLNYLS